MVNELGGEGNGGGWECVCMRVADVGTESGLLGMADKGRGRLDCDGPPAVLETWP